jgi:hypothetical protein
VRRALDRDRALRAGALALGARVEIECAALAGAGD